MRSRILRLGQSLRERLQCDLAVQLPAEGTVHEHSFHYTNLHITQVLYAYPGGPTVEHADCAKELIRRYAHQQGHCRR